LFEIYCLMAGGSNLTNDMRTLLFFVAQEMHQEKKTMSNVVTDDLEARIETDFSVAVLGSVAGPVFSAEITSIRGGATVTYIVRAGDLKNVDLDDLRWTSLNPDVRWN